MYPWNLKSIIYSIGENMGFSEYSNRYLRNEEDKIAANRFLATSDEKSIKQMKSALRNASPTTVSTLEYRRGDAVTAIQCSTVGGGCAGQPAPTNTNQQMQQPTQDK